MGSDDLFKKRRQERQKRKFAYQNPKANSYPIVTEGERTEPLYFRGLAKRISEKTGGNVNVYEMPMIDIHGEGCSTGALIKKAEELANKSKIIYENIWVVFDKDDFLDFDDAIALGESKGFHVAWSNQCFEYWLYMHFHYSDSALHRDDWFQKLTDIFQENHIGDDRYQKNYESIYDMLEQYGNIEAAIANAKRRMSCFDKNRQSPSSLDPVTTVHILVQNLKKYLDE